MNNSNILPGMVNNSLEIFVVESVVKAIHSGKVIDFTEMPLGVIELLKEHMRKDEKVLLALHDMHPFSEWARLEQFAKCRFGGLDHQADFKEGIFQDGEYWDCPVRSSCPHNGVICKLPVINDHRLTDKEVEIMQLSTTELTNDIIAEKMKMPAGTFHKEKKQLHHILKVQTKQGITKICNYLNLI